jgi:hypothetical protein
MHPTDGRGAVLLHFLSIISLIVAGLCAVGIALDIIRLPQPMSVMNLVWPITALYFGPIAIWTYLQFGRAKKDPAMHHKEGGQQEKEKPATWNQVAVATSHCGAGCTIADVLTEFTLLGWASHFLVQSCGPALHRTSRLRGFLASSFSTFP